MILFKNILINNSPISYVDAGVAKNIVVLLHGFGEDATIWQHQIIFLQKKYRVIAPNIAGTGNSSLLLNKNATIAGYAVWLHQLLENILPDKNQKITLLGHSMGGYITLAFANLFPQKLNAFGLIHSTAFADTAEKKQVRLRGIEAIENYGSYAFLKNTISNLFSNNFKQHHLNKIEKLIESNKTIAANTLQQYFSAMMSREDTTTVLKKTTVPVLFITGTEDVAAPMQDVLKQCHLPQQAQINILENVGHIGMLETPENVNDCLASFLGNCIHT